jgi:hypothetical protein
MQSIPPSQKLAIHPGLATLALPGCAGLPALPVLLGGSTVDGAWSGAIRISGASESPRTKGIPKRARAAAGYAMAPLRKQGISRRHEAG